MLRKIIAIFIIVPFSITMLPPVAFTQQDEVLRSILEEGIRAQRAKEERKTTEEWESNLEWRTFVCPTCQREFHVSISEQDQELQRGLREITCPYDDTKFIPRQIAMREALKEEPRYVTIISPY